MLKEALNKLSFRHQLGLAFGVGIVCLAVTTSVGISAVTEQRLRNQLIEQGRTIVDNFSRQGTLALLYQSPETADDAAKPVLSFPSVAGVALLTPDLKLLHGEGNTLIAAVADTQLNGIGSNFYETEDALYFSIPVYAGEEAEPSPFESRGSQRELVGYAQVTLSKAALETMGHEILRNNLAISSGVALVMLLLLLGITNGVTRPIKDLSTVMKRAQDGEFKHRANLSGSREVINMGHAFNTMLIELGQREEQLRRARDTALASAKIKGQFATTVSHELRTPMNGVMGMLELLQSMDLSDEQREYINIARSSGEELLLLIDDILDFSKIEAGKMKLHPSHFDPRDVVKGITELLSAQAQQKQLRLEAHIDDKVPATLIGDTSRIRQILINLVGNGIKFTHQGSVKIRIGMAETDVQNSGSVLYVSVEDTGIGIQESAQQLIFEAFSQADGSTTRQFGGTGLGLAICSQLVELMGGNIGVESTPGKGSLFWFTIPVQIADTATSDAERASDRLAGVRVLIVSRTTDSCHDLVNKFVEWQCFQRNTTTVDDAMRLLRNAATQGKPYDFLIIDTPLSDHGEESLLEKVRTDRLIADTNTLVLTHYPQRNLPERTRSLSKSPTADQLRTVLLDMSGIEGRESPITTKVVNSERILIVEDNQANQLVAKAMVERLGFTAEIADHGNAAIAALERDTFDLILMDCHMPHMNGYTAAQLIRGKESPYQNIPIVALTANTGPADVGRCFTAGMNDYLPKPLSLEKLGPKLDVWLKPQSGTAKSKAGRKASNTTEVAVVEAIDKHALDDLRGQIREAFEPFVRAYLTDTPDYIKNLRRAIDQHHFEQVKYFAQVIKSSSSNLGAHHLEQCCSALEALSFMEQQDEDLSRAHDLAANLQREFSRVAIQLQDQLSPPVESEAPFAQYKPRILIVDDDNSSRIVMQSILEKDGYDIVQVTNGLEAVRHCQSSMPDLILMDALMPVMDGFTACEQILALESDTSPGVLMITALQDEGTLERAFSVGATDFIVKPINMTVLRQRVSRMLHASHIDRHIHQLSYYDNLTALPNRTFFVERCKKLLESAEAENNHVAVMFLDLDRFKMVNDTQGHESGDELLKGFSKRLEACVRSADIVARLGGDEFTVVLNNIASREAAAKVADKILESLQESFTFRGRPAYISASIGIALFPENAGNISELMKFADTAMFHAKTKGGACYEFYEPGMENEITRQIELEIEIREALEQDQFVLFYQPQVDLRTGKLTGMEALIRWQHPSRGLVPPGEFIPFAEKSGLITMIGDWVLHRACLQQREWLDRGLSPVPIAVNVSGKELADSVLLQKVERALADTKVPAHLIKLEITEDTLAGSDESTTEHLQELRNMGTTLAIDDFGTGYSSLSYLKLFPVDTLKIDRSFIKDLPEDSNSAAIVAGIIALGHSLKLSVVAEGVETEEQKRFLQKEGCDTMQGYFLCKPLPVKQLEEWIVAAQVHHGYGANGAAKASYPTPRLL